MFAVIAYTNYRKEVSIKVHGYATTEESAIEYAKQYPLRTKDLMLSRIVKSMNATYGLKISLIPRLFGSLLG